MKIKQRVTLEPPLQEIAGHLDAHARVMLAKKFYRWSVQLYVSARILRLDAEHPQRRPLKLPARTAALN